MEGGLIQPYGHFFENMCCVKLQHHFEEPSPALLSPRLPFSDGQSWSQDLHALQ